MNDNKRTKIVRSNGGVVITRICARVRFDHVIKRNAM